MTTTSRPVREAMAGMARARADMDVPRRSITGAASLPDTAAQVPWRPAIQHFSSSPRVLSEIERNEQRLGQRPDLVSPRGCIDAVCADHRNWSNPNSGGPAVVIARRTEQGHPVSYTHLTLPTNREV